jgi:hypothetical protein
MHRKPSPSPLLTLQAGGKAGSKHRRSDVQGQSSNQTLTEEVIEEGKVDDLLAQYTTIFSKGGKRKQKKETEKKSAEDDKLEEEFLQSTRLDDYNSDDETSVRSISSSDLSESGGRGRKFRVGWVPSVFSKLGRQLKRRGTASSQDTRSLVED